MGVIFAERSSDDVNGIAQDRYSEIALEFSLGAFERRININVKPPHEIYQNRSEGCQTQRIYYVSDGRDGDRQEVVC